MCKLSTTASTVVVDFYVIRLNVVEADEAPEIMNDSVLWAKDLNIYICNYFLKDSPFVSDSEFLDWRPKHYS